jgi:uncharacterized protein YcsI (UPF0317 family)
MGRGAVTPAEARARFRDGLVTPTAGWCPGWAQANLLALPRDLAYDFLLFAQRNPKPCPVLDVLDAGAVPVEETTDVTSWWRDDLVSFLIGCSFTFEAALAEAGVPVRHVEQGVNVPMYRTARRCRPAGAISGPLVVSMRPVPADQVADAVTVTARYPAVHGAPVHVGDPSVLGIDDLDKPDYGDAVEVRAGEVPVFWGCGVTPQAAVVESRPSLAIAHAPGHMLVTDARDSDYLL